MNINNYFPKDEIDSWKRLVIPFHDKLLLNNDLSDIKAVLICLYMLCNLRATAEVNYSDVKNFFVEFGRTNENFKVNIYNAKKQGLLCERIEGDFKLLSFTTKGLKSVKDLIGETVSVRTWVIEAGKVYSGKKLLQEIVVPNIGTSLYICDPYIGARTLDFINNIGHKCKIQLLTQTIQEKSNFERELNDFKKEFPEIEIEVRIFSKTSLHDRYMISDGAAWSIGSSLKDLGNKDTLVTRLGNEVKFALTEVFENRWLESVPLA
jgi:hypothetical protein